MAKKTENQQNATKGWAVKKSGSSHTVGYYRTQKEAIKAGEAISKREKVNVVIFESRSHHSVPKLAYASAPGRKAAVAKSLTPQEKAEAFRKWAAGHKSRRVKPLSDEAISRESIYEDRW